MVRLNSQWFKTCCIVQQFHWANKRDVTLHRFDAILKQELDGTRAYQEIDTDEMFVANGFVSSKIYDKRDDFGFDTVNFPFLDSDVPRRASYIMVFTFRNLLGLLESAIMLQTSTLGINVKRPIFSNRAIGIITLKNIF